MKITRQALQKATALPPSFDSFFSFPLRKTGYSGCAVYTRRTCAVPLKAEEGLTGLLQPKPPLTSEEKVSGAGMYPPDVTIPLSNEEGGDEERRKATIDYKTLDSEGRAVVLDMGLFVLINTYCPNDGTGTEERDIFKMQYHRMLQTRIDCLIREGREVMLVGDINACAAIEDHCEGQLMVEKGWAEGLEGEEGFWGKESRRWMRDLILQEGDESGNRKGKLVDIVRKFWPDRKGMYTCWNTKISARDSNYGTRIDFILITPGLVPWIKAADIQPEIKGSDHCPVFVDFHDEIITTSSRFSDGTPTTIKLQDVLGAPPLPETGAPADPPRIAAKYWEEYKQKLLSNFFGKKVPGVPTTTATQKSTKALFTPKASASPASASQDTDVEMSAMDCASPASRSRKSSLTTTVKPRPPPKATNNKSNLNTTSPAVSQCPNDVHDLTQKDKAETATDAPMIGTSQVSTNSETDSQSREQLLSPPPTLDHSASSSSDTAKSAVAPEEPQKMSKRRRDLAAIIAPVKKAKISKSSSSKSSSSFLSEMKPDSTKGGKSVKGKEKEKAKQLKGKEKVPIDSETNSQGVSLSSDAEDMNPPVDISATPDTDTKAAASMDVDEDADYRFALQLAQSEGNIAPDDPSSEQSQGEGSSVSERYKKGRMRSPIRLPSPPSTNGNGKAKSVRKDKEQNFKQAWNTLLAPIQAPLCVVHQEPTKEYTVNKPGPNKGKKFFTCSRSVGPGYDKGYSERPRDQVDPQYKCNFFKWSSEVRKEMSRNAQSNSPSKSNGNGSFDAQS
ncbi:DNA-(apurinic or apyrimidinic site) endonuclease 2 [Psilocybe cubensis]|uniref:DNA-(Apurinic or apyrimidinic site) endonuclease 2 n=2 Tax=Psilocybe cubensis TaxID=181762 RepID=A0ACB8GX12_PSICU|nr:DNA-(apurinic or apyrimidinic site) endonuclease 2 [Psilocybe cubensis]KAH9479907.1 DNA-(apurinic or apyrimidinic site) endonuclease 2 [Psilocybe cubensis]